jgi:hypothetical protein
MPKESISYQQKSIYLNFGFGFNKKPKLGNYSSLFLENITTSIMPIGGKKLIGQPFFIKITPYSDEMKIKFNILFPSEFHSCEDIYDTLENTVSSFISNCVSGLLVFGKQYFEIVPVTFNPKFSNNNHILPFPMFTLVKINGIVMQIGKVVIQIIPYKFWSQFGKKIIILSSESIFKLKFPKIIGSKKTLNNIIKGLNIADGEHETVSQLLEHNLVEKFNFNIKDYYKELDINKARLIGSWGSLIRMTTKNNSLEYYEVYREIQYSYTLALFREYICSEMNKLLKIIGFNCEMTINGITSSTEIEKLKYRLERKEISFNEIFDETNSN